MYNCVRCKKCFRNNYDLDRHKSRKFQCKENIETENKQNDLKSTLGGLKSTLEGQKSTSEGSEKHLVGLKSTRCEYCLQSFANTKTLTRHYDNCKDQDDPVRQLEIQHKIEPVLPDNPLECRFCNKTLSRKTILQKHFTTCKKKQEYHLMLKKPKQTEASTDSSGNTYNINFNNIFINGQEENTIGVATIVQELKNILKIVGRGLPYLTAGTWITAVDKAIRENPQNQNVIVSSTKSMTADVLTESGWVTQPTDLVVERCFHQAAKRLHDLEQQITDFNSRAISSNNLEWCEVGRFARDGLRYRGLGGVASHDDQTRRVRSAMKVALVARK
jgi:hypothetical protein